MSETYTFVFSGHLEPGAAAEMVKIRLAKSFGMPVEKIERIFTGRPVVIKRGLDQEAAERFQRMFAAAGAIGEIRAEAQPAPAPAAPAAPAAAAPPPAQSVSTTAREPAVPSGFWRRLLAFWVDSLIIAVPGWIIGWAFYDQLVRIGQNGRLIGVVISLAYFAILNSAIGNGQTLGKRLLKIRVVNLQGETITLPRSALRYLVLELPFFFNGYNIDTSNLWIGIPLGLIVFGLGGSIVYFFLFNRRNRRTVHDFFAGTVVVKADPQSVPQFTPTWRGHYVALAVILVGLGALATVMIPSLMRQEPFAEMITIQQQLQLEPGVHSVGVQDGTTRFNDNTSRWLAINIVVSDPQLDLEETADHFATLVLTSDTNFDGKDLLVVNVTRGYDIGISSGWQTQKFSDSPAKWRSKLGVGRL